MRFILIVYECFYNYLCIINPPDKSIFDKNNTYIMSNSQKNIKIINIK